MEQQRFLIDAGLAPDRSEPACLSALANPYVWKLVIMPPSRAGDEGMPARCFRAILHALELGADHQDGAAAGGERGRKLIASEERPASSRGDEVALVAMAVDVRASGVPEAGLVDRNDTGFQHFSMVTDIQLQRLVLNSA